MYAVIVSGGKQYKVSEGDSVIIDKIEGKVGSKVDFDVLLLSDGKEIKTGKPVLKDIKCEGEIIDQDKSPKITVFTYRPKENERRKKGHRELYTKVKILSIK